MYIQKIQNHYNPNFEAKIVVDSSYEKLGEFANKELLPKLKESLSGLGNDSITITLKGKEYISDWHWGMVIADIAKIRKNKKAYYAKKKPFQYIGVMDPTNNSPFGADICYTSFVGKIKNIIANRKNFPH